MGAFFEVTSEEWPALRKRERNYSLQKVDPQRPLAEGLPDDAYYFTWGSEEKACSMTKYNTIAPQVSQAYWDFIIGGILAWDGQLRDTGLYTWDLDVERSAIMGKELEDFKKNVAQYPTLDYAARREIAVEVVQTSMKTGWGPGVKWVDDRRCPFTGNAMMTRKSDLRYPPAVLDTITAEALGTSAPVSSPGVRQIIDEILNEGGWNVSERASFDCEKNAAKVKRDNWTANVYWDDVQQWTRESTPECNGHGYYLAVNEDLGFPMQCHCFGCWAGPNCETETPLDECNISAIDPELTYQWKWFKRHESIYATIPPYYGMHYGNFVSLRKASSSSPFDSSRNPVKHALEKAIVDLHRVAKNAKTDGYHIVTGMGAHQILSAAIHALSNDGPKAVYAQKPCWARFAPIARSANTLNATWTEADALPSDMRAVVEIHTTPNNPDNKLIPAAFDNSLKITDRVYHWPNQKLPADVPYADDDLMVFSMSKLTSHPGLRFGWALVKDPVIAERMKTVISDVAQNIADVQALQVTKLLQAVVTANGTEDDFFQWSRAILHGRFKSIEKLLSDSDDYSLASDFGSFLLIKCHTRVACASADDSLELCCQQQFTSVKLGTRLGSRYGYPASDGIIMMSTGDYQETFDAEFEKLKQLVGQ